MSSTSDAPPVVLSLRLDERSEHRFDLLRRRYFPPERLVVGAHLTLFHALPGDALPRVLDDLRSRVPDAPVLLAVSAPRSLGRGVAYDLDSEPLRALHRDLQRAWGDLLSPQDSQRLRPHVTVQNKVSVEVARRTLRELADEPVPATAYALGVRVWYYRGGPWDPVDEVGFGPAGTGGDAPAPGAAGRGC